MTADDSTAETVKRTAAASAVVAAVLSPIPLADELILAPTYGVLSARIGRSRGLTVQQMPWRPVAATIATALVARAGINLAVAYVPFAAAAANATSAYALTGLVAERVDRLCADPHAARSATVSELAAELGERARALWPRGAGDGTVATGVRAAYGRAKSRVEHATARVPGWAPVAALGAGALAATAIGAGEVAVSAAVAFGVYRMLARREANAPAR